MRKINTGDVFKLSRILRQMNLNETVKALFDAGTTEKRPLSDRELKEAQTKKGLEFALLIISSASSEAMEKEIYSLLGGIIEKEEETIKNQPLEETLAELKEISENNNLSDFFTKAGQLTKKS